MVPIEMEDPSRTVPPKLAAEARDNLHISAVPAVAVFVGLISLGDCVVQDVSFVEASVQPIKKVMVDPAIIMAPVVVHVMLGAETVIVVHVAVPPEFNLYEILAAAFAVVRPLKANVVAEGEAEVFAPPGKVSVIVPDIGISVLVVN